MNTPSTTRIQTLWLVVIALACAAGLIDSLLIHIKEVATAGGDTHALASCSINSFINCTTVAQSKYAYFLKIPVAVLGIMFYVAALTTTTGLLFGFPLQKWQRELISVIVIGGLVFSLRLLFYSYFAIGSLCPYCLVSDFTSLVILIFWLLYAYYPHQNTKGLTADKKVL